MRVGVIWTFLKGSSSTLLIPVLVYSLGRSPLDQAPRLPRRRLRRLSNRPPVQRLRTPRQAPRPQVNTRPRVLAPAHRRLRRLPAVPPARRRLVSVFAYSQQL